MYMDIKSTMIHDHFKTNWRFYLTIVYFTVLILLVAGIVRKQNPAPAPEPTQSQPMVIAEPKVDIEPLTKRIEQLERELEKQAKANQTLAAQHDQQERANQRLERRTQSHLEAIKRMCEYIVVITVDKKIIPRQCLPEYRWSTTEGN
jgi:septal ring factor EnvC (AmiA/AmiB activator)